MSPGYLELSVGLLRWTWFTFGRSQVLHVGLGPQRWVSGLQPWVLVPELRSGSGGL